MSLKQERNLYAAKRGDTIIEVMFAIAVFCLVAVLSVSMMNLGVAQAENSLEVVTARGELNAQAEALRFIHSSYISELTLPTGVDCNAATEKCQQYTELWNAIKNRAIAADDIKGNLNNLGDAVVQGCSRIYKPETGNSPLSDNNAFILNTRDLQYIAPGEKQVSVGTSMAIYDPSTFVEAPLNARVIFKKDSCIGSSCDNSTTQMTDETFYNRIASVEGMWIFAVKGNTKNNLSSSGTAEYYDFYIQSCWYGPSSNVPQSIDTVIRLYEPNGA